MSIKGLILHPTVEACPYLEGLITLTENFLAKEIDEEDQENLLSYGFRHFGESYFRPICPHCLNCISIRIPVKDFVFTSSIRKILKRGERFDIRLEEPIATFEMYELYMKHKMRFKNEAGTDFPVFVRSMFHPFSFSKILTVRDGEKIVCVSHLDITKNTMSAIYCYYDDSYSRYSLGRLAVYKEIEIAKQRGIEWLYLGFYVPGNIHMQYKIRYKPNQLMRSDFTWIDYMDVHGNIVKPFSFPVPKIWNPFVELDISRETGEVGEKIEENPDIF